MAGKQDKAENKGTDMAALGTHSFRVYLRLKRWVNKDHYTECEEQKQQEKKENVCCEAAWALQRNPQLQALRW